MGDAARPSDAQFSQVLEHSLKTWSSYLDANEDHLIPRHAVEMRPLVNQTPPFLGGVGSSNKTASFACEEKHYQQSNGSLLVNGRSTWKTSEGNCDTEPKVMPKQLLLGVGSRLNVDFSDENPFSVWPGVQGLSSYDQGNHLSILYLAWAYILSARWVELLSRSSDHECHMAYTMPEEENPLPQSAKQSVVEIDIGDDACEEEAFWWRAISFTGGGWEATSKYNGRVYLSPWSVSTNNAEFTLATKGILGGKPNPPESVTALKYLSRFCVHHHLYAQCSVALAGVLCIPFLMKRTVSLPFPKQDFWLERKNVAGDSHIPITKLLNEHSESLSKYMTLSSNVWGLRSLLCSTFYNPEIECNLVSAWLNPAFAVLGSISQRKSSVAALLANRQPRLGILWLGAIFTGVADSVIRDIRTGMAALDLPASAWAGVSQTFLTSRMGKNQGELLRRDDESRLLFITACEGHERPPVWSWKPFGFTQLDDSELAVRQHVRCAAHCLEYESWEWILTNNSSIMNPAAKNSQILVQAPAQSANRISISGEVHDYDYPFYSQSLSEIATRGIFEWLRSTGYPRSERPIYQHSWLDLEGTDDEEEPNDTDSDLEIQQSPKKMHVEKWLKGIE